MTEQPTVRIFQDGRVVGTYPVKAEGVTTIGRASSGPEHPDIPLPGEEVSRRQCHVVGKDGKFTVYDGWPGRGPSRNGTLVDGQLAGTDEGDGVRVGDGSTVVVPARAKRTAQLQIQFQGIPLLDKETITVAEEDLDENTARIGVDEDRFEPDQETDTQRRRAWIRVLSGPAKSDLVGLLIDRRIDPRKVAIRGKRYELGTKGESRAEIVLGRSPDADVVVIDPDPSAARRISRKHAALLYSETDAAWILVNHSPNGTLVGRDVEYREANLKSGDRFAIGNTVFGFVYEAAERPPWYVRHPWITRAAMTLAVLGAVVALGALGYLRLMNRVPDRVLHRTLWTALGVRAPVYSTPAIVDLNRDGYPDVVVAQSDGHVVAVDGSGGGDLWNQAVAKVREDDPLGAVFGPLVAADMDGDGFAEVIVPSEGKLAVIRGDGSILWSQDALGRGFVGGAAVADMDGNGVPDIVLPDGGPGGGGMVLRGESGAVMFQLDNAWSTVPPAVADLNGDGVMDIVVACRGDGTVVAYDGRTRQRLWDQVVYEGAALALSTPPPLSAPAVGDLTGDGSPDVVVITPDYSVAVLDGRANGSQVAGVRLQGTMFLPPAVAQEPFVGAPVLADLNRDGRLDVVAPDLGMGPGGQGAIYAFDGANLERVLWKFGTASSVALGPPALADLDRDGSPEVLALLTPFQSDTAFARSAALEVIDGVYGNRLLRVDFGTGQGKATPLVADLDGDRRADVLVALTDGTVQALALNVPFEQRAVAWGSQRGGPSEDGTYRPVPRVSERILLAAGIGGLAFAILFGIVSGVFALAVGRWSRRRQSIHAMWEAA